MLHVLHVGTANDKFWAKKQIFGQNFVKNCNLCQLLHLLVNDYMKLIDLSFIFIFYIMDLLVIMLYKLSLKLKQNHCLKILWSIYRRVLEYQFRLLLCLLISMYLLQYLAESFLGWFIMSTKEKWDSFVHQTEQRRKYQDFRQLGIIIFSPDINTFTRYQYFHQISISALSYFHQISSTIQCDQK